VDDYTAWVTGESAEANRAGIKRIVREAEEWERRSGASFEGEKTCLVHYTRNQQKEDEGPITVKGQAVHPMDEMKVLGVLMDKQLRYKRHIANTAARGMRAAMALRRLKTAPCAARKLFDATVTPVLDYASNVWRYACGTGPQATLERAQRIGAQAITGAFRTVATVVAEAEAGVRTIRERWRDKATRMWTNLQSRPGNEVLLRAGRMTTQRFISPMQRMAAEQGEAPEDRMETIRPYALPPWGERLKVVGKEAREMEKGREGKEGEVWIATSSSARRGRVGIGKAIAWGEEGQTMTVQECLVGSEDEQNPYTAELVAIAQALRVVRVGSRTGKVVIVTRNRAVLLALRHPQQQSGQYSIIQAYQEIDRLKKEGKTVQGRWSNREEQLDIMVKAKEAAGRVAREGGFTPGGILGARATVLGRRLTRNRTQRTLPAGVGQYSKDLDTALPAGHTRNLYDPLDRKEATTLAQLRTGMARLNGYLHRIGAVEEDRCACDTARETVKHFLFRCPRWDHLRAQMMRIGGTRMGCASYYLGGKRRSDPADWKPNYEAVRTTINFAAATGRLETQMETTEEDN
jgi:hypothetical protein